MRWACVDRRRPLLLSGAMPESTGRRRRGPAWRLSNAHAVGQLARIRCGHCRISRYYEPADLQQLFGDVEIDQVVRRMRCERCGLQDYLNATLEMPTALERTSIRIRRLAGVRMVRKVVWRDE